MTVPEAPAMAETLIGITPIKSTAKIATKPTPIQATDDFSFF